MLKQSTIFLAVLIGCFSFARAQGFYTTANAISPGLVFPKSFNLEYHFEPGTATFGYHTYTIDANLKLALLGTVLGPVQAGLSVVNDGDVLDSNHILSVGSLNGYQLSLNQTFLVGMDMVYVPGPAVTAERFGWARLEYTANGLQILDQATALGGDGIIAGTTTVLPEPSTLSLIGIGAAGMVYAHRRLKSRRENGPPVG